MKVAEMMKVEVRFAGKGVEIKGSIHGYDLERVMKLLIQMGYEVEFEGKKVTLRELEEDA